MSEQITQLNAKELLKKYEEQTERAQKAALSLQAAVPLTHRSLAVQEAFLLAVADFKLLQHLLEQVRNIFNGIALKEATAEQIAQSDEFASGMFELAEQLTQMIINQFGVAPEAVTAAIIKDLARSVELVETVLVRAESAVAEVTA